MLSKKARNVLERRAAKVRATSMQRHVLVCRGSDCDRDKTVSKAFKHAVAEAGLRPTVTVSRVDCLDICREGTVAVVYPEGTWYADVDRKVARRITKHHLGRGRPVGDHAFLANPLGTRPGAS